MTTSTPSTHVVSTDEAHSLEEITAYAAALSIMAVMNGNFRSPADKEAIHARIARTLGQQVITGKVAN